MTKNPESDTEQISQVYELGYHLIPTLSGTALSEEVLKIKEILTKNSASVIAEEGPQLIDLAYRIDKHIAGKIEKFSQAHFGWMKFEASPADAQNIHTSMEGNTSVIRSLLIRTVRENTLAPRRFMTPREETSRRPDKELDESETPAVILDDELNKTIDELVK